MPDSYFRRLRTAAARLPSGPPLFYQMFAVRFAHGVLPAEAFARLQQDFGPTVLRYLPAENIVNLQNVDGLPLVLAGLVVFLGSVILANTLAISVRRRRRDLAILKALGFGRRQVASTVAWQATSFILVALVLGLPLGVTAGRWAWDLVAARTRAAISLREE
ncbi:MAG TPA: ABC transporter permease [Streptosporangiaceae bacterium]|nr:ABC transporter permease [Streptosporangiaceae bacterium]